jgi:hypothetical protein
MLSVRSPPIADIRTSAKLARREHRRTQAAIRLVFGPRTEQNSLNFIRLTLLPIPRTVHLRSDPHMGGKS